MTSELSRKMPVFLFVFLIAAALFFFKLGDRSFRNPDEGRYAEIARQMVVTGDWIEPKVFGVEYLRKPPLFYWLVAVSFKIFGFSEFAARFVPALFGLLGVSVLFWVADKLFDIRTAVYSALILATNCWYLQVGRYLLIDMVFSVFVASGLLCFFLATGESRKKNLFYLLFYFCAALAFLCKGPVALVLMMAPAALYTFWAKNFFQTLKESRLFTGSVLFLLIVLPWFILISKREPDFLRLFFLHENVSRFTSSQYEHQEPWYFYLMIIPVLFLPWIFFLGNFFKSLSFEKLENRQKQALVFSLITAISVIVFFSFSKSKLVTYILPAIPFLSLLIGFGWQKIGDMKTDLNRSWGQKGFVLSLFIGFLAIVSSEAVKSIKGLSTEIWPGYLPVFGGILLTGSFLVLKAMKRGRHDLVFYWIILMMAVGSLPVASLMDDENKNFTTKHLALNLEPTLIDEDNVLIYDSPGPFYDFGYYLQHPVKLVGLEGEVELYENDAEAIKNSVSRDEFERLLTANEAVYCLIRRSDFNDWQSPAKEKVVILEQDAKKVLFKKEHA